MILQADTVPFTISDEPAWVTTAVTSGVLVIWAGDLQSRGWGLPVWVLNFNCKVEKKLCFSGIAFPQLWLCLPQGCCLCQVWEGKSPTRGQEGGSGGEAGLLTVRAGEKEASLHFVKDKTLLIRTTGDPWQCRSALCSMVCYPLWFKRTWSKVLR